MDNITGSNALSTLLAAGLGGIIVKFVDWLINKENNKQKETEQSLQAKAQEQTHALELRKELWDEMNDLKDRLVSVEQEVVCWKSKYFELLKEYNTLEVSAKLLTEQFAALKQQLDTLSSAMKETATKEHKYE